jgi:hypothetical protein
LISPVPRLAAAGHVGDLDLADPATLSRMSSIRFPLTDLGVVQVEVHSQVRAADGLDERAGVGGPGERGCRGGPRRC